MNDGLRRVLRFVWMVANGGFDRRKGKPTFSRKIQPSPILKMPAATKQLIHLTLPPHLSPQETSLFSDCRHLLLPRQPHPPNSLTTLSQRINGNKPQREREGERERESEAIPSSSSPPPPRPSSSSAPMALHNPRILFPVPNATFCITTCNEACQFYNMCSAPPPYSSLPFNSTPDSTTIQFHHGSTLLPNLLIAAASLVAASLILLAAFYALLRFRLRRRDVASAAAAADGDEDDDLFEMGEADVHHVWYVRTVGLDEPTIRSIAAWAYKAGDGLLGAADDGCPVCLADFHDGELLRLLPKCGHAFHLPCIDTWLRSHLNCPLCRAPIVAPPAAAAAASDPVERNTGSSALAEDSQMAVRPQEADRGEPEVETESAIAETGIAIDPTAAPSSPPPSSQLRVPSDLGEDGLQKVRRSVSMGSSSLGVLLLKRDPDEGPGEERKDTDLEEESTTKNRGKQGNASKGAYQQKDPQEMEGSLSSSSGRFLLSRHGRGQSAVLPL